MSEIESFTISEINAESCADWRERPDLLELLELFRSRKSFCLLYALPVGKDAEGDGPKAFLAVLAPDLPDPAFSLFPCRVALCRFSLDEGESLHPLVSLLARCGPLSAEGRARALADTLFETLQDNVDTMSGLVAERLLEALIYTLAGRFQREDAPSSAGSPLVTRALAYMQGKIMHNISLAELCASIGVGQEHFIRTFKKEMHISPMKYFGKMRLRKSVDMLLQGRPIQEVAYALGFYNESHFSRMFKQYLGASPRRYKIASLESLRQRKIQADRRLALTVSLLSDFVDAIPDFFFVKDLQFVTVICNQAYSNFVGQTKEFICGKTDFELFPPDAAAFFRSTDKHAFASGKSTTFRRRITYPDGHQMLVETSKSPCFDESGRLLGLVCVGRSLDDSAKHLVDLSDAIE